MRSRYTFFTFVAYLALAIGLTYPVAFQLTTHIAGLEGSDSLEFIWSIWWFKRALLDLHTSPLNISVLNHPEGLYFPLLPAMAQSFIVSLPLAILASPVVAFNVTYLLSFPLCALAGYWLCYDLTGDRRAAFLGGLIWGFFPNKSGHALAGHLFQLLVFTLPLAVLFLLRALRQPSARDGIMAGVALALAATIHPINVAYFLIPFLLVALGFAFWDNRSALNLREPRALIQLPLVQSLLITALVGGAFSLLLVLPALLQREQLGFLVERGGVGFSLDLTTFITPAPNHPFFIGTSLADYARRVDFFEFEDIGYLGFAPLILAGIGLRWRWRENRIWFWLGLLTAVLSLGPVLHIGREIVRVLVENDRFPILMPYAFLGQLPFFQWSRTPGRLNETTVFALMIMAAYGMATVLSWIKNQKAAGGIWLLACLLIPIEYLVRWPMPTAPIPWSPALADLARDDSFDAMMNFPVPEYTLNLTGLIQQTFHQHPMIGGRVYRDQPGALILHDFLSRMITATTESDDIAPGPTPDQRAAAFSYYGVGRIIYQPQGDADGSGRAALNTLFGAPVAADDRLSIYTLPNDRRPITDPFFVFGANWHAPQPWLAPTRWFKGIGTVYVFSPQAQRTGLAFTAIPGQDLRRLIIKVNRYEIAHFGVGDWADFETPTIQLETGLNTIEFFDEDGSWRFVGDPRCQGGSAVAGPFLYNVPCDAADRESRDYSLAIQNLRFVPEPAQPAAQATFANGLELLEATLPAQSKPGEAIIVHLAWRATQTLPQDYTLFLHLVGANGQLIAGNDSPPARGSLPTTRWRAGQVVKYNAPLILPPDAPPGNYTLSLGWYAWPSLERLSLPDGETAFTIGALQVSGNG